MGVTLKTVMPGVTVRTNSSTGSRTVRFACMINGVRHTKMCDLPIEILIDQRTKRPTAELRAEYNLWVDECSKEDGRAIGSSRYSSKIPTVGELCRGCRDVAYQFLHRTASACHMANGPEGRTPVLVYQLFFDGNDAAHVEALESFKSDIRRWAARLRLRNMKFLILSVPVTNMAEANARFATLREEMFDIMRREATYKFDFDGIRVESVVDIEPSATQEAR